MRAHRIVAEVVSLRMQLARHLQAILEALAAAHAAVADASADWADPWQQLHLQPHGDCMLAPNKQASRARAGASHAQVGLTRHQYTANANASRGKEAEALILRCSHAGADCAGGGADGQCAGASCAGASVGCARAGAVLTQAGANCANALESGSCEGRGHPLCGRKVPGRCAARNCSVATTEALQMLQQHDLALASVSFSVHGCVHVCTHACACVCVCV